MTEYVSCKNINTFKNYYKNIFGDLNNIFYICELIIKNLKQ